VKRSKKRESEGVNMCGAAEWDANGTRHIIWDVRSWRSRRRRMARLQPCRPSRLICGGLDRRTICAVDKVWKGVERVHWLCAVTHWTLSRMANLRRPMHGTLARGNAPLPRPVITRVRNLKKQCGLRMASLKARYLLTLLAHKIVKAFPASVV
jgi:hypothetical protein